MVSPAALLTMIRVWRAGRKFEKSFARVRDLVEKDGR